jgi:hypothetical protein
VNRRAFLGAQLAALLAALSLPFEQFAAWCKTWLTGDGQALLDELRVRQCDLMNFERGMRIEVDIHMPPDKWLFSNERAFVHPATLAKARLPSGCIVTHVDYDCGRIMVGTDG